MSAPKGPGALSSGEEVHPPRLTALVMPGRLAGVDRRLVGAGAIVS